jgi:hypothetical protein
MNPDSDKGVAKSHSLIFIFVRSSQIARLLDGVLDVGEDQAEAEGGILVNAVGDPVVISEGWGDFGHKLDHGDSILKEVKGIGSFGHDYASEASASIPK